MGEKLNPILLGFVIFSTIAILLGILVGWIIIRKSPPPAEITLSIILSLSIIALLAALTFMVYIFKFLDLASPNNTLGLPEGSIRAVIALSLILIFVISCVFLYNNVSYSERTEDIYISQAEYNNISKELIYSAELVPGNRSNETWYLVKLQTEKNEESVDIAKQIITTVSTLVVAVAGFYFGSNSVAAATKAATGVGGDIPMVPDPIIYKINPSTGVKKRDITLEIKGKNLSSPNEVKLIRNSDTIPCIQVTWNDTMIRCNCKLEIPDDPNKNPAGTWTLVVINSQYVEGKLVDSFTVEDEKSDGIGG